MNELRSVWEASYEVMRAFDGDYATILVHGMAIVCAVFLLRDVPDWLQGVVIAMFIVSGAVYVFADLAIAGGERRAWVVRVVASRIEHASVLLYLFRQVWIRTGVCKFLNSLH